jgi:hypothetical protein
MPGEVTETRHPIERRDSGDGDLEPPEWARRRIPTITCRRSRNAGSSATRAAQ